MSAIDFSDPATITLLTDALTAAGVDGLEISRPGGKLRIVVSGDRGSRIEVSGAALPTSADKSVVVVKAPMAGLFCASHPSRPAEHDHLPRPVSAMDVLGFMRIGPVLLPLCAGRSGVLTRRLAEADALVGFGASLFEIEIQT